MAAEEKAHARFSFSGAHRWLNCEGSIALSEGLPAEESSPYAKKGTLQHEVNKKAVTQFLDYKITGIGGVQYAVEDDDSCEFEAQEAIRLATLYTKFIWENVLQQAVTGKAYGAEEKVVLDAKLDLWGSTDFWACYINDKAWRTGVIVDYKNGHFVVAIKNNPQLMLYAAAFRAEMKAHGKDLDVVRTVIIQPNAECEAYRECSYTAKQLDTFVAKIYKKVNSIVTAKAPKFKVGDWCTFCPAMALCEAYKKDLDSKNLLPILKDKVLPDVQRLSDKVLSTIALHSGELEDFISAIKAHIISRHVQGAPVAGCKVVEKGGKRSWIKNEELIADKLKAKGLEPYRMKLITITEAKKKLKDEELTELTESGKSSFIIVSPKDERPSADSAVDML